MTVWVVVMAHASDPLIKAISPKCSQVVFLGSLIGALGILAYAASPTDIICKARIFFPAVGFGLVFGMLTLKTYRIYTIFGYSRKRSAKSLSDNFLLLATFLIGMVEVIICAAAVFSSSPSGQLVQTITDFSSAQTNQDNSYVICGTLDSKKTARIVSDVVLYLWNSALLCAALALAVKTRGAFKRFAESKAIALVTYVVAVTAAMGLLVLYAIPNNSSQTNDVINMVRALLFFVLSAGTPPLLFGERLLKVMRKKRAPIDWGDTSAGGGGNTSKKVISSNNVGASDSTSTKGNFAALERATVQTFM
ncbi:hypothetical protein HDU96_006051, partial [Phlyctochytrium bullatum]